MTAVERSEIVITQAAPRPDGDRVDADPITTEVIRHALISAAERMSIALRRTAFSPVVYEMLDLCAVLYDRDVRLLAQAQTMPQFLGTMGFCVEACVRAVGGEDNLDEGDVLFSTYAYDIGSHAQDAAVVMPAFVDGELVGYAGVKAHHMDMGAKEPYCTDTTDVFQEGVIFPGVKLYRRGELQEDLYRTLVANSRLPVALEGDLNAEMIACRMGVAELSRIIGRHGLEQFRLSVERIFDHGEAVMRSNLDRIPDGRYTEIGTMDSNGVADEIVPFAVAVEVSGSDVVVDFTESPPEQPGPINCPLPETVSCARMAVLAAAAGGGERINEGHLRPITVRTRPGTMLHPRPPAPIFLFGWIGGEVGDAVLHALTRAMPEAVPAGSGGDVCALIWWGERTDGSFSIGGADHFAGHGASVRADGPAPMMFLPASCVRNTPAEAYEAKDPMIVRRFELAQDSGGAGRFRGGLGVDIEYEFVRDTFLTATVERTRTPPWGLDGGHDGRPNGVTRILPDGTVSRHGKVTRLPLPAGTRVQVRSGGGGGFGALEERDPAAVREDLRQGYISERRAREDYPHAFEAGAQTVG